MTGKPRRFFVHQAHTFDTWVGDLTEFLERYWNPAHADLDGPAAAAMAVLQLDRPIVFCDAFGRSYVVEYADTPAASCFNEALLTAVRPCTMLKEEFWPPHAKQLRLPAPP